MTEHVLIGLFIIVAAFLLARTVEGGEELAAIREISVLACPGARVFLTGVPTEDSAPPAIWIVGGARVPKSKHIDDWAIYDLPLFQPGPALWAYAYVDARWQGVFQAKCGTMWVPKHTQLPLMRR